MQVHGGEDVGVDDALLSARLLPAGVDGVGVPVGPEQGVLIQGEGEGVRQLPFNHHLSENTHTHEIEPDPAEPGRNRPPYLEEPSRLQRWMKLCLASAQ